MNKVIGKSPNRIDAYDKVTGRAKYVADIFLKNLKYGCVLRSIHHHALIKKIDLSLAFKQEGVIDIITYKDLPAQKKYGVILEDRPVLADGKVRFIGEPIAIIVAVSKEIACKARDTIIVEYEKLPAIFDPVDALSHNSEKIHEQSNLITSYKISQGDIEVGTNESDLIFGKTFRLPTIYPGYLETEACIAEYNENSKLNVWVSSQKPFDDRKHISKVLGINKEKINVITQSIGGAFGGKEDSNLPILTALAAWKIKGNIKFVNTRSESILGHPKRHACIIKCKIGTDKNGKIKFLHSNAYVNAGAYASYSPPVGQLLTETVCGTYNITNVKAETFLLYTNTLVAGAMRGFGVPQSNFVIESMIDIIAARLKVDSIALRRKNILTKGNTTYTGVEINQPESISQCLNLAEKEIHRLKQGPKPSNKKVGIGLALAVQTMGLGYGVVDESTNSIECLPSGHVIVNIGAPDLGQGLKTVSAQIVAEALGIDYSLIIVNDINTNTTSDGGVCCASRMTYCIGNSLLLAAGKLKKQMIKIAADVYKLDTCSLDYDNGKIVTKQTRKFEPIHMKEIAAKSLKLNKKLKSEATFFFPYKNIPPGLPVGMPHVLFCFGAFIAMIEIDQDLGLIEVKEFIGINDVGKVINCSGAEGQVEGGAIMGMGYALMESVKLNSANQWNDSLTTYLMPTSLDAPLKIKSIFLENKEISGPYGAKGIGEITVIPVASAIANAIYNATGKRYTSIPIMPNDLISI